MTSKLKEARLKAGYSIEDVAKKIKIRKQYLINLEENMLEDMPGMVYVEGYKRIYHDFLGLELSRKTTPIVKKPVSLGKGGKVKKLYISIFAVSILIFVVSIYSLVKLGEADDEVSFPEPSILEEETAENIIDNDQNIVNNHGNNKK